MSYDLKLFRVPEGVEPEAAYEQLNLREESEVADSNKWVQQPLPDSTRATMQQLVDSVRKRWPSFVQFQPASPQPRIELNDEDLQIQFTVYEETASIAMPYSRGRTDERMKCIGCCLTACRDERGYVAYDPQLGRVVTVNDLDRIAQLYLGVEKALPSLRANDSKAKPWWKFW